MRKSAVDRALDPDPKGPIVNAVDGLLLAMGDGGEEKANKFPLPVTVPGVGTYILEFRYPENSGDLNNFEKGMTKFVLWVKDPVERAGFPPAFIEALSVRELDDDDLCTAFIIYYWSHPDLKISQPQALRMVAHNASISRQIMKHLDAEINRGAMVISFGGVLEKKADSKKTTLNESDSKPASSTAKGTTKT
jgi:hypothetical protein